MAQPFQPSHLNPSSFKHECLRLDSRFWCRFGSRSRPLTLGHRCLPTLAEAPHVLLSVRKSEFPPTLHKLRRIVAERARAGLCSLSLVHLARDSTRCPTALSLTARGSYSIATSYSPTSDSRLRHGSECHRPKTTTIRCSTSAAVPSQCRRSEARVAATSATNSSR